MNQYNIKKVAHSIIYFLNNNMKHFGKTKLMKLMYFSDKQHLEIYGRTIFFDDYYKLERGPVANLTLNIINNINEADNEDLESYTNDFLNILDIEIQNDNGDKITKFISKSDFNSALFSKSEISVLEKISHQYNEYTKKEISDESHLLNEYKNTELNSIIDIADMVESSDTKEYISYWNKEYKNFNKMIHS